MRILHTSDLHGHLEVLLDLLATEDYDLWVDSGDFFPNFKEFPIDANIEVAGQAQWGVEHLGEIAKILIRRAKSMFSVPGNHDFVSLADILKRFGCAATDLTTIPWIAFQNLRFAGFREIPYIRGDWQGECHDIRPIVDKVMGCDPTILVTHAPPAGILDGQGVGHSHGIVPLSSYLMYRPHSVKAHLFGHLHVDGGKTLVEGDILFSNAATRCQIVQVSA